MERLTTKKCRELLVKYNDGEYRSPCFGCESINICNPQIVTCGFYKTLEKLAEYEDLEEQGKLIKLPCKVGDRVYVRTQSGIWAVGEVRDFSYFLTCGFCVVVTSTSFDKQHIPFSEFGKTIFIREPEAEEALQRKEAGKAHEKEKEQPETEWLCKRYCGSRNDIRAAVGRIREGGDSKTCACRKAGEFTRKKWEEDL